LGKYIKKHLDPRAQYCLQKTVDVTIVSQREVTLSEIIMIVNFIRHLLLIL